MAAITTRPFGSLKDGSDITAYRLTNAHGNYIEVINYGAALVSIVVKDENDTPVDVLLGYDCASDYEKHTEFFGACIGRIGNRIGGASFTLDGKDYSVAKNDGANHLHGGIKGFDKCLFDITQKEGTLECSRLSKDMEEGYPGNLKLTVTYSFDDENALHIDYKATTDQPTIINLTNHAYFNLSGHKDGSILDHTLVLSADRFCEGDTGCLPTGKLLDVIGTPFNFIAPKTIGKDIDADDIQLKNAGGYDHNYCLNGEGLRLIAVLSSPKTGIQLEVSTDQPGVQLYSGNFITDQVGKDGAAYTKRSGICLETQKYPDGIHHENFPSPILRPGETYTHTTIYKFCS